MTPKKAISFWEIKPKKIEAITEGIFNETYKVYSEIGELFVLQKLHNLISERGPTKNYASITNFLAERDFLVQKVLPNRNKDFLIRDGGRFWRLLKAVPGLIYTKTASQKISEEAGKILGKLHKALKNFHKPLMPTLPMFQYGEIYNKLKKYKLKLARDQNKKVREVGNFLLNYFPKFFLPEALPKQVIHTDPKISNFVFDNRNRAISMIDWDTAQKLSPLYDLGDALRSFCGNEEDDPKNSFNFKNMNHFLAGYFDGALKFLSNKEKLLIPQATSLVILGLATRFINDYVEDFYFNWNRNKYKDRRSHNLARALGQISLFKSFEKQF